MNRPFTSASVLSAATLAICVLCPAARGENLPPGTYVYLGESVGTAKPRLLTVTSVGKITWQDSGSSSSITRYASASRSPRPTPAPKIPNPFFYPASGPSPSAVIMPKIGGSSIAPMPKAGMGTGPRPTPINIASTSGMSGGGGAPTPVPFGGGARSIGGVKSEALPIATSEEGRSAIAHALDVGQPFFAATTSTIDGPPKPLFDDSAYPTRKWKPIGVAGHPEGVAQLNTTYEEAETVPNRYTNYASQANNGQLKARLILMKVQFTTGWQQLTVSLLDKDGFSIVDIQMPAFHEVPGTSLLEGQVSKRLNQDDYKRAYSYSVH